jgi:hypothetical protein
MLLLKLLVLELLYIFILFKHKYLCCYYYSVATRLMAALQHCLPSHTPAPN